MGKYSGYFTTKDVCECECKEASHLMRKHNVPRSLRKKIISMIREPWFRLSDTYRFHSDFDKYLKEIWDIDLSDPKYIKGYFRWECIRSESPFMRFIGKTIYDVNKNTDLRRVIRGEEK